MAASSRSSSVVIHELLCERTGLVFSVEKVENTGYR